MNRRAFATAVIAALGLVGCRHEAAVVTPWRGAEQRPALVLAETSLERREVVDALFESWVQLEGRKGAARTLLAAAVSFDGATLATSGGARDVVAYAIYQVVQAGVLSQRFAQVRDVVDRMVKVAPKTAQTRFALAYLRWILLADGSGQLTRRGMSAGVVTELYKNLDLLVREHSDYDGPGSFTRQRLRRERDAVAKLLAAPPAKPSSPANPASPAK